MAHDWCLAIGLEESRDGLTLGDNISGKWCHRGRAFITAGNGRKAAFYEGETPVESLPDLLTEQP